MGEGEYDMEAIIQGLSYLVDDEYRRSANRFGALNASNHESYAIILEEREEAKNGTDAFDNEFDYFWNCVKINRATEAQLESLQRIAEKTAAEWVQVAAMCHKARVTIARGDKA